MLTQEEIASKIELIRSTLEKQGAVIKAVFEMGSRPLAYKIKKFERGFYVVVYFEAQGKAIKELERIYRINEDIIRFIVIKYEKQVEIKAWENMVKKALGQPHTEVAFVEKERRPRRRPDFNDQKQETPKETAPEAPKEEPKEAVQNDQEQSKEDA